MACESRSRYFVYANIKKKEVAYLDGTEKANPFRQG